MNDIDLSALELEPPDTEPLPITVRGKGFPPRLHPGRRSYADSPPHVHKKRISTGKEQRRDKKGRLYPVQKVSPREDHPIDGILGRIYLDLNPIMRARGIVVRSGPHTGRPNLTALSRGTGIGYYTCFYLLRRPGDSKMLHLETLARLCAFLRCQPGDMLRYAPRGVESE